MREYKYWGLDLLTPWFTDPKAYGFDEIQFRDTPGGAGIIEGGTAHASGSFNPVSNGPDKAVDGTLDTRWFDHNVATSRWWYEFATPVSVVEYLFYVKSVSGGDLYPKDWDFIASDDGIDWDVISSVRDAERLPDQWNTFGSGLSTDLPVFITGETHTNLGLIEAAETLQRPEFQGETLTEIGAGAWASYTPRWEPMVGVDGFEAPEPWVSYSPRTLVMEGEPHTTTGRMLIEKRELGAGEQATYGRAFLRNWTDIYGPVGHGRPFTLYSQGGRAEHKVRGIRAKGDPVHTKISLEAEVHNLNKWVSVYNGSDHGAYGKADVRNRNRAVWPIPTRHEEIPHTHLVQRRKGQALPKGQVHTTFGAPSLELSIRELRFDGYVTPWAPSRFYFIQTPMVYPEGESHSEYGRPTLLKPDRTFKVYGGMQSLYSTHWVSHGLREVRRAGADTQHQLGDHAIRNGFERVTFEGDRHDKVTLPYIEEKFNWAFPRGHTHDEIGHPSARNRNRIVKAPGWDYSVIAWPDLHLSLQHAYPSSVFGQVVGRFHIKDTLQRVFFVGDTHSAEGICDMYTGEATPPVSDEVVYMPSLRRGSGAGYGGEDNDAYWIGAAQMDHDPRRMYPAGLTHDDIPEGHEVSYLGSNADSLNLMTRIGEFNVFGGDYFHGPYGGDDPYTLYGQARFTPDRIYATNDIPTPNPYPGTAGWHPPDHAGDPDDVRMGDMAVDLKNRFRMAGAADQSLIPLGHQAAFPDPEPQGVFVQGQSQTRITNPYVGGGVREVFIVQLLDHAVYGEHLVGFPEPPAPLYYDIDFTGYGKDHSEIPDTGGFDNFDRPFRMAGVEPTNIIPDTHWVSRSPRHVPYQDDEVDYDWGTPGDTAEYGLAWASFYKRYFELGGGDQSWTLGFSPPNILNRTYVKNVLGEDGEIPVFPAGTEHSQIGAAFLSRGSICS